MKRTLGTWLIAACAAAGCSGSPATQVLTGSVTTTGAVAVRAVSDGNVVTAGRVRSDGSFTLALPAGASYRLEILSATGVTRVVDGGAADITFRVCTPIDPFDLGTIGDHGPLPPKCDPATDPNCPPLPPGCDPATDPNCPPPPPPCDPATNANCPPPKCDPATDANCPPPPPFCDPATDANCPPPPPFCDPATDANCPPPPPFCDPATDPNCPPPICDAAGNCQPPKCDPAHGDCPPPCDPTVDANCGTTPPPCLDPTDPSTCKDPCMDDPAQCGCSAGTDPNPDPGTCWPPPCDGPNCDPGPHSPCDHPPTDFGCMDPSGT